MEKEQLLNRMFAVLLFLISFIVYFLTVAPTTSFWDCGEFIACAYILGVPHPPGAPFYLLLGRIFSLIPWAGDIGLRVNIISAIATAFTVMLTYLIIVKLIKLWRDKIKTIEDRIIIYGGGIVGALAFAFSDSLWFNAVEAEVYAISMFFTAVVVWLILVWHEKADQPSSDRYILIIAYFIGLAIGVHLLSLLALPVVFLTYYFRRHVFNLKSLIIFGITALIIFWGIYPGIVKWLPNLLLILNQKTGSFFTAVFFITIAISLIVGIFYAVQNRNRIVFTVLTSLLLILVGASTFPSVYFRSKLNPAIDENDPENLENLVSYINREQYGDWSIVDRRAPLWEYQIKKMYLRYLFWQYVGKGTKMGSDGFLADTFSLYGLWAIPFLIGMMGMIHHFFKDYRRALVILILFIMTGLAIVIYLNQPDPQPRERDYVYVASFFAFAIWIGIGVTGILESVVESIQKKSIARKLLLFVVLGLLILFIPVNMLAFNYHSHDRSGNYVAYDYSYNLLQSCDKDAILFTNGDNDTFPLWFLQYVYNIRRDVRVVNLSLLNTHWYIKQLRDQEPKVPITLTDIEIDQLAPMYWPVKKTIKMTIPDEIYQKELEDLEQRKEFISKTIDNPPEITFDLGPTFMGQAIRVQDWMILEIIASNRFKKPIYFSITVSNDNMLNMDDYLRMDGLVYKLITYPGEKISPSRLRTNLFDKYNFRNLNNPEVYYDDNILGLLINYRSGFLRLADFYRREKMYDSLIATLNKMEQAIPESVIPLYDQRISLNIGNMYLEAGRPDEFERRLDFLLNQPHTSNDEKLQYAQIYYQFLNNHQKAEEIALEIISKYPEFMSGYYWLFSLYAEIEAYEKGTNLAKQLLTIHPDDKQAKFWLRQIEKLSPASQDSNRIN